VVCSVLYGFRPVFLINCPTLFRLNQLKPLARFQKIVYKKVSIFFARISIHRGGWVTEITVVTKTPGASGNGDTSTSSGRVEHT
jgi:hypothetical protein